MIAIAAAAMLGVLAADASAQSGGGSGRRSTPRYSQPPAYSQAAPQGSGTQGSGAQGSSTQGSGSHGSGSQGSASQGSDTSQGSGGKPMGNVPIAMRGFCPVCLVQLRQWVPGDTRFTYVYDGKAYRFPGPKQLQMFQADPVRYTPALGGDNIVHYAKTGERIPGDLANGVAHQGRVFFVGSQAEQEEFKRTPSIYANADLAMGGDCVVCKVDMNQTMPGLPQTTFVLNGVRYQFMGLQQQRTFAASPTKYVQAADAARMTAGPGSSGSGARVDPGSTTRPNDGSATRQPAGSGYRPAGSGSGSR